MNLYRLGLTSTAQEDSHKILIRFCGAHIAEFKRDTYYVSGCKQVFKPESEQTNFTDWQEFNAQLKQRYQISCLQKFTPKWVERDKADDLWTVSLCNDDGIEVCEYCCKAFQLPVLGQSVSFDGGAVVVRRFNKESSIQRMIVYGECKRNPEAA